jgi:hypothetical protein
MAVSAAIIYFLQFTVMRFLLRKFCEAKKNRDLLGRGSMGWILVLESHRPASRWRIPVAKVGGGLEVLFHPVGKCSWGALELQALKRRQWASLSSGENKVAYNPVFQ